MYTKFVDYLDEIIQTAKVAFTYQKMFDVLGISDLFDKMYITSTDLSKKYVDLFYKGIKNFVKQPLYKDLDLKNEKDLKYIRDTIEFRDYLSKMLDNIKKSLEPKRKKVLKYLKNYSSKSEISLEEILKSVQLDRVSLLIILESLKEDNEIYDYNGREVTLK